jgi:hypothetical protein
MAAAGNRALARAVTLAREPEAPAAAAPTLAPSEAGESAKLQRHIDGVTDLQELLRLRDALNAPHDGDFDLAAGKETVRVYAGRHRLELLDRIAFRLLELISERFAPVRTVAVKPEEGKQAAPTAAPMAADTLDKKRSEVIKELAPWLTAIRTFGTYDRHPEKKNPQAVSDVELAFQLMAVDVARGYLAQQNAASDVAGGAKAVQAEAIKAGKIGEKDAWCGAFAFMASQGAGLTGAWASLSQGTGGYQGQFNYDFPVYVYDPGRGWRTLRSFHEERKSMRSAFDAANKITDWKSVLLKDKAGNEHGPPQPGDIVLIDNAEGLQADHVQMLEWFDAAAGKLKTIGGNEVISPGRVNESERELKDAGPDDQTGKGKLVKDKDGNEVRARAMKTGRLRFVGRWSLVDFESHVYSLTKPDGVP